MAPFMEELAFRGVIQNRMRKYVPAWAAILVTALFFGLWHRNTGQFVYTFVTAILFGWVYEFTGKLRYTMLMHFSVNLISAMCYSKYSSDLLGQLHVLPWIREKIMDLPVPAAAFLLIVTAVILVILARMFREDGVRKTAGEVRDLFPKRPKKPVE